jgi:hypothetical protein
MKKSKKGLLIYPPNQLMDIETPRPDGSLGPLYIASSLESEGIETDILGASVGRDRPKGGPPDEQILEFPGPDIS